MISVCNWYWRRNATNHIYLLNYFVFISKGILCELNSPWQACWFASKILRSLRGWKWAPKFAPSSSVGLHLESPHLRNQMVKSLPKDQQTFSLHIHIISVYANLFKVMLFRKYRKRQCCSFGGMKVVFLQSLFSQFLSNEIKLSTFCNISVEKNYFFSTKVMYWCFCVISLWQKLQ